MPASQLLQSFPSAPAQRHITALRTLTMPSSRYRLIRDANADKRQLHGSAAAAVHGQQRQQQPVLLVQALPSHDTATTGPAAGGAMEQAIDAIGLGRFHVFLLLCVSLIWAGAPWRFCRSSSCSSTNA